MSIREWSEDKPITCVLLHGLAEGSFVFDELAEFISASFRVVAVDLRGHGDSERGSRYDLESYVADVRKVLLNLRASKIILVGHSLGGDVAANVAAIDASNIIGLALLDTGPVSNEEASLALRERILAGYKYYSSPDEYIAYLADSRPICGPDALEKIASGALKEVAGKGFILKFDPAVTDVLLEDNDVSWWWSVLPQFQFPVLIVRGRWSAVLPKALAEKMRRTLKQGRLRVLDEAGHSLMFDNPAAFVKLLSDFLTSLA